MLTGHGLKVSFDTEVVNDKASHEIYAIEKYRLIFILSKRLDNEMFWIGGKPLARLPSANLSRTPRS